MFGVVLDLLARLAGAKPRVLNIYRKLTVAIEAVEPFSTSEFAFEMKGQENLSQSIHPSDEKDIDYLSVLQSRDTLKDFEQVVLNTARGVLKYALYGKDNPKKNLPHLQRVCWLEFIYHVFMLALLGGVAYIGYLISQTRGGIV